MSILRTTASAALAAAFVVVAAPSAKADDAEKFYSGRTVTVWAPVAPGGIYSNFAQILVRHMERHMPPKTNMIVQHMEGAGGVRGLDYVYNVAPKDGSAFVTPLAGPALRVLLRLGPSKYDPAKMHWLGGWGESLTVLSLLKGSPAATIEEAKQKEVILGSLGRSTATFLVPTLMNNLLGTKFKIITGYTGGAPIRLAMEKGEIHGWSGQWEGWTMGKPEWLREGKLIHLVQVASKRSSELPSVPLLSDLAKDEEQRNIFSVIQSGLADRAFVAPPGVPKDRLALVAKAYQATLRDPAFVADAKKQQFAIDPIAGEDIQKSVERMMSTPPATVERMRKAMGLDNPG
jgi:tripartite-type tricarboxylate transporter receptor subunit TctC